MFLNSTDKTYNNLAFLVLNEGRWKSNRTGIDTLGVIGAQAKFDLSESFPILTTKKIHFKSIVHELLWFISGSTNVKYLQDNGVRIWNEWADENGDLGYGTYGSMWRRWETDNKNGLPVICDQMTKLIQGLKEKPESRRHIVSAWNPYWVDHCALPPCHVLFQFNAEQLTEDELVYYRHWTQKPKYRLSCHLYQRSCDLFLGVPFNIASYALLTCMVAQVCNMAPYQFIHTYNDLHIYDNHLEQIKEQLTRKSSEKSPGLRLNREVKDLFDFQYDDIELLNYEPKPAIKADVAV